MEMLFDDLVRANLDDFGQFVKFLSAIASCEITESVIYSYPILNN
ncbi:MAG: hypothetical protein ACLFRN_04205 [Halothece sp.]